MSAKLETLMPQVEKLNRTELQKLQLAIDMLLANMDSGIDGEYAYTEIRTELHRVYGLRAEHLKQWKQLSQNKKKEFQLVWRKGAERLKALGFKDPQAIQKLLIRLITQANCYEQIGFENVLDAAMKMETTLRDQFPGYSQAALAIVEQSLRRTP